MSIDTWLHRIQRIYQFFSKEMNMAEFERLVKTDAPGIYQFYRSEIKEPTDHKNKLMRLLLFAKNLFLAFLNKLNPARRFFYLFGVVIFIIGLQQGEPGQSKVIVGFLLLNVLLAFELADKLIAKDELEVARNIQLGLMPKSAPQTSKYAIEFFIETANDVGGDYYNFLPAVDDPEAFTVIIGDISGKGMAAALHMVQLHTLLQEIDGDKPPKEFLSELNDRSKAVLPVKQFFTATVARFAATGKVDICRAGHMPILYYDAKKMQVESLTPSGVGMGLMSRLDFRKNLKSLSIKSGPGDVFVLYTDGLIESWNSAGEEFGEERLRTLIQMHAHLPVAELKRTVLSQIAIFRSASTPKDDLTLLLIKRN